MNDFQTKFNVRFVDCALKELGLEQYYAVIVLNAYQKHHELAAFREFYEKGGVAPDSVLERWSEIRYMNEVQLLKTSARRIEEHIEDLKMFISESNNVPIPEDLEDIRYRFKLETFDDLKREEERLKSRVAKIESMVKRTNKTGLNKHLREWVRERIEELEREEFHYDESFEDSVPKQIIPILESLPLSKPYAFLKSE